MSHFNRSKIYKEAESVISNIELALQRQAGFKFGDPSTHSLKPSPEKEKKVEKLRSLLHYTCYLEKQNDEYFSTFASLTDKIRALEYTIKKLQHQSSVDKSIEQL